MDKTSIKVDMENTWILHNDVRDTVCRECQSTGKSHEEKTSGLRQA